MSDKRQQPEADAQRRKFLKAAGLAGGAAAVGISATAEANNEAPPADPKSSRGYHETEHVRAYYRSARI